MLAVSFNLIIRYILVDDVLLLNNRKFRDVVRKAGQESEPVGGIYTSQLKYFPLIFVIANFKSTISVFSCQ